MGSAPSSILDNWCQKWDRPATRNKKTLLHSRVVHADTQFHYRYDGRGNCGVIGKFQCSVSDSVHGCPSARWGPTCSNPTGRPVVERCKVATCEVVRMEYEVVERCAVVRREVAMCEVVRQEVATCEVVRREVATCEVVRREVATCEVVRREVAMCEMVRLEVELSETLAVEPEVVKSVGVNGMGVPFETAGEGSESVARVAWSPPGGTSDTGEGSESVARVARLESELCEVERCRKHLHWLRPPNLVGMEANAYCWGTVGAGSLALYAG